MPPRALTISVPGWFRKRSMTSATLNLLPISRLFLRSWLHCFAFEFTNPSWIYITAPCGDQAVAAEWERVHQPLLDLYPPLSPPYMHPNLWHVLISYSHLHTNTHKCIYAHACIHTLTDADMYVCVSVCVFCMCMCMHALVRVCACACMAACVIVSYFVLQKLHSRTENSKSEMYKRHSPPTTSPPNQQPHQPKPTPANLNLHNNFSHVSVKTSTYRAGRK